MGRPSVPILSMGRITNAAMDLVTTTGGFTIPGLARNLGSETRAWRESCREPEHAPPAGLALDPEPSSHHRHQS